MAITLAVASANFPNFIPDLYTNHTNTHNNTHFKKTTTNTSYHVISLFVVFDTDDISVHVLAGIYNFYNNEELFLHHLQYKNKYVFHLQKFQTFLDLNLMVLLYIMVSFDVSHHKSCSVFVANFVNFFSLFLSFI